MGVVCDIVDAKLIIERYDQDKDGRLGFWEFSNALLPLDPIMRDDLERRKAVISTFEMSFDTKELLRRVFRKIVDSECIAEMIRQRIDKEVLKNEVSLRKAFDVIDWNGRGIITANDFKRVLDLPNQGKGYEHKKGIYGVSEIEIEIEGLLRRFNKDKLNGRVSLAEFIDELNPK